LQITEKVIIFFVNYKQILPETLYWSGSERIVNFQIPITTLNFQLILFYYSYLGAIILPVYFHSILLKIFIEQILAPYLFEIPDFIFPAIANRLLISSLFNHFFYCLCAT